MTGRTHRTGWLAGCLVAALMIILASLPPFVGAEARFMLMQGFETVCHQIAERSIQADGVPFALCHRCYGIFCGLFLGMVLFAALRSWERALWHYASWLILLSLGPLALDWFLGVLHLWQNTPVSRLITGGLFGAVAGLLVAQALSSVSSGEAETHASPG